MKRILLLLLFSFLVAAGFASFRTSAFVPQVFASSEQAYKDYLYQSDVYRQKYNDFKVAQNEYFKFNTLTSQQTALAATRDMMAQRDVLLKTYLLLLNEKLNEAVGITDSDRNYYQSLIKNENAFLINHAALIPSVGSINDATTIGRQLEDHYNVLQASMLQIISGISYGNLTGFANDYDKNLADAKALVNANRGIFASEKQSLMDRWLLQISNTRSLYQGKLDAIANKIVQLKVSNNSFNRIDPTSFYEDIKTQLGEGRQYLLDGTAFMGELVRELRYQN